MHTIAVDEDTALDQFTAVARKLSAYSRKTIVQLTHDQPLVRRAALALRRETRGLKLARRLRRKVQLGRHGSF